MRGIQGLRILRSTPTSLTMGPAAVLADVVNLAPSTAAKWVDGREGTGYMVDRVPIPELERAGGR